MSTSARLPLVGIANQSKVPIVDVNARVWFIDSDGYRVVSVGSDTPLYRVALDDEVQLRFVAIQLHQSRLASQEEIARAFKHSIASQRRWERRYEAEGMEGLRRKTATGPEFKIAGTQEKFVRKWFDQGLSNAQMARRLGVTEGTVRNALKRLGLKRAPWPQTALLAFEDKQGEEPLPEATKAEEPSPEATKAEEPLPEATKAEEPSPEATKAEERLPEAAAPAEEEPSCEPEEGASSSPGLGVVDPLDRSLDRLLARLGLLDDADPAFAGAEDLPRLGILLVIPLIVRSGVLRIFADVYRSIGPAFYGLRTSVLCLILMALLRIKRPENLKEYDPAKLGRLLGLDRAPEVKTLRRKLDTVAQRGRGLELMDRLARNRLEGKDDLVGVLYVDDHVKEYHGEEAISKAYISRRRLATKGTSDTWVNDVNGDPIFVVPNPMNASLSKTLEPTLQKARELVGPDRQITVVFDRGGWSTNLFFRLTQAGFHVITYRRGYDPGIPLKEFTRRTFTANGRMHEYQLHDKPRVRVGKTGAEQGTGPKYLWMRQVTRRRDGEHQTPVITDRTDLAPEEVLYLMFNRWRQENFFKYMREEFALDGLIEYGVEPLPQGTDRPNPEVRKINKDLAKAHGALKEAKEALGEQARKNQESARPTMRGFKIANAQLLLEVANIEKEIEQLMAKRASLPKRVPATNIHMLKQERNLVADAIKMCAYQIESELHDLLSQDYARSEDEGRTLLHAAFQSSGKLEVTAGELRATLALQSSPHRSRVLAALCERLNTLGAKFPGTDLRIVLSVAEPLKKA